MSSRYSPMYSQLYECPHEKGWHYSCCFSVLKDDESLKLNAINAHQKQQWPASPHTSHLTSNFLNKVPNIISSLFLIESW